jgi:glycosyltransferase involved in cell wall biosynthesis
VKPAGRAFSVCVLANLRDVKDPLRAAWAAARLPAESRVEVVHAGAPLVREWEERARAEERANPRYRYVGPLLRGAAAHLLRSSHVVVLSSLMEGGANVLGEAMTYGVPALASRVEGNVGLLGDDHPGLFPAGDTEALAALLLRCEREPGFLESVRAAGSRRAWLFAPARERDAWRRLMTEVLVREDVRARR